MATAAEVLNRSETGRNRLESQFNELAERWKSETAVYAASWQIKAHPAFRELIAMGMDAVPLLLNRLSRPCIQWFMALCAITDEDPSPAGHAGIMDRMAGDWLQWGKRKGYLNGEQV